MVHRGGLVKNPNATPITVSYGPVEIGVTVQRKLSLSGTYSTTKRFSTTLGKNELDQGNAFTVLTQMNNLDQSDTMKQS